MPTIYFPEYVSPDNLILNNEPVPCGKLIIGTYEFTYSKLSWHLHIPETLKKAERALRALSLLLVWKS